MTKGVACLGLDPAASRPQVVTLSVLLQRLPTPLTTSTSLRPSLSQHHYRASSSFFQSRTICCLRCLRCLRCPRWLPLFGRRVPAGSAQPHNPQRQSDEKDEDCVGIDEQQGRGGASIIFARVARRGAAGEGFPVSGDCPEAAFAGARSRELIEIQLR